MQITVCWLSVDPMTWWPECLTWTTWLRSTTKQSQRRMTPYDLRLLISPTSYSRSLKSFESFESGTWRSCVLPVPGSPSSSKCGCCRLSVGWMLKVSESIWESTMQHVGQDPWWRAGTWISIGQESAAAGSQVKVSYLITHIIFSIDMYRCLICVFYCIFFANWWHLFSH